MRIAKYIKVEGQHHHVISTLLIVALAVLSLGGIYFGIPIAKETLSSYRNEKEMLSSQFLEKADTLVSLGRPKDAFTSIQYAIESAKTERDSINAALKMGSLLLDQAKSKPEPYALMSRQYAEYALDMKIGKEDEFVAHKIKAESLLLTGDIAEATIACEKARQLAPTDELLCEITLTQIDLTLQHGKWSECERLLKESYGLRIQKKWMHDFAYREALVKEQIILNRKWHDEWVATIDVENIDYAQSALEEETVARFQDHTKNSSGLVIDECLFRIIRLLYNAKRYGEMQEHLDRFISRESGLYQSETLVIMSGIARQKDHVKQAEQMMSTFIKRFNWHETARTEIYSVVDLAINSGYKNEALALLDNYLSMNILKETLTDDLYKAGTIASSLGNLNKAASYFERALKCVYDREIVADITFALADICIKQNRYDDAEELLIGFVNRFSYHAEHSNALFKLFDVQNRDASNTARLVNTAALVSSEEPDSPRIVTVLMTVAERLEHACLYSLAQKEYNKIILLNYLNNEQTNAPFIGTEETSLHAKAILGSARCLMKTGNSIKADRMLRELCNNQKPSAIRSEAAFHWAMIARDRKQEIEALRRLEIVNTNDTPASLSREIGFERILLEISVGKSNVNQLQNSLKAVCSLDHKDSAEKAQKIFNAVFRKLEEEMDAEGMRKVFDIAVNSVYTQQPSLNQLSLQMGNCFLRQGGVSALIACINTNEQILADAGYSPPDSHEFLLDLARSISTQQEVALEHL